MPKATQKSSSIEEEVEEVIEIEDDEPEMEAESHHALNPIEAKHHAQRLNEAIQTLEARVESGEIKDILKDMIKEFKEAICIVMPTMAEGNVVNIL